MSDAEPPMSGPDRRAVARTRIIWVSAIGIGAFVIVGAITAGIALMAPGSSFHESYDQGFARTFFPSMHDSCVKAATAKLSQPGRDPATDGDGAKIETYCSCLADTTRTRVSLADLQAMTLNRAAEPGASAIKTIADECRVKVGL
jgi:hypothetical protein